MPLGLARRAYGSLLDRKPSKAQANTLDVDIPCYENLSIWKVHTDKIIDKNKQGKGSVLLEPTLGRLNTRQNIKASNPEQH